MHCRNKIDLPNGNFGCCFYQSIVVVGQAPSIVAVEPELSIEVVALVPNIVGQELSNEVVGQGLSMMGLMCQKCFEF